MAAEVCFEKIYSTGLKNFQYLSEKIYSTCLKNICSTCLRKHLQDWSKKFTACPFRGSVQLRYLDSSIDIQISYFGRDGPPYISGFNFPRTEVTLVKLTWGWPLWFRDVHVLEFHPSCSKFWRANPTASIIVNRADERDLFVLLSLLFFHPVHAKETGSSHIWKLPNRRRAHGRIYSQQSQPPSNSLPVFLDQSDTVVPKVCCRCNEEGETGFI